MEVQIINDSGCLFLSTDGLAITSLAPLSLDPSGLLLTNLPRNTRKKKLYEFLATTPGCAVPQSIHTRPTSLQAACALLQYRSINEAAAAVTNLDGLVYYDKKFHAQPRTLRCRPLSPAFESSTKCIVFTWRRYWTNARLHFSTMAKAERAQAQMADLMALGTAGPQITYGPHIRVLSRQTYLVTLRGALPDVDEAELADLDAKEVEIINGSAGFANEELIAMANKVLVKNGISGVQGSPPELEDPGAVDAFNQRLVLRFNCQNSQVEKIAAELTSKVEDLCVTLTARIVDYVSFRFSKDIYDAVSEELELIRDNYTAPDSLTITTKDEGSTVVSLLQLDSDPKETTDVVRTLRRLAQGDVLCDIAGRPLWNIDASEILLQAARQTKTQVEVDFDHREVRFWGPSGVKFSSIMNSGIAATYYSYEQESLGRDCPVCQTPAESPVRASCGCDYCKDCLSLFFSSTETFPIACITCLRPLTNDFIRQNVAIPDFSKLLSRAIGSHLVQHSERLAPCPSTDCSGIYEPSETMERDLRVGSPSPLYDCGACHQSICTRCKTLMHAGISCTEKQNLQDEAEVSYARWKRQQVNGPVKKCPRCRRDSEKVGGCGLMHCLCGRTWTWAKVSPEGGRAVVFNLSVSTTREKLKGWDMVNIDKQARKLAKKNSGGCSIQ